MANPTKFSWTLADKYMDGSAFGAADYAGVTLEIDGAGAVSVPAAYNPSGSYEMPLANFPAATSIGSHTLRLFTVAKNGITSDPSNPATYTIADERKPSSPKSLSAS